MRKILLDSRRATAAARVKTLHHKSPADRSFLDVKPVDIELMVVLRVGDRRLQHLLDVLRNPAARERELGERSLRRLAADHRRDKVELAWAGAQRTQKGR